MDDAMPNPITSRQEFARLREKRLRREVIIPLFQKMGMRDVRDNHGVQELGKDAVCWFSGPGDIPVNVVVVAKAGNVTGKSANEVARQVGQAFNTSFATGLDNIERTADLVWVVTNGQIPELSRTSIQSQVQQNHKDHIRWMDGDEMWKRWTEHFPITLNQIREQLRQHTSEISDPAITVREWIGEHGRGIEVLVKDPSQLTDKHTKGRIHFNFPDTPQGREAKGKYLRHIQTGEPLELSGEHFKFLLPEILEKIVQDAQFSDSAQSTILTIARADDPHRFPIKVDVICDDGDHAGLDYVEWRILQSGTEETTFINDQQAIPLRFKMVFPSSAGESRYEFYPAEEPLSAGWTVKVMDLQRCLNKPGVVKITLLNSGKVLPTSRHTADQPPDFTDDEYNFFVQLAAVEQIVGQPVAVPEGSFSSDDESAIALLLHLLRDPEVKETWTDGAFEYDPANSNHSMDRLLSGEEVSFTMTGEGWASLGGRRINLGPASRSVEHVRLADVEETRQLIKDAERTGQPVRVRIVPGSTNRARLTYLNWVDADPAVPYRDNPPS